MVSIKFFFPFCFLGLNSCFFSHSEQPIASGFRSYKESQKIHSLQKKLQVAIEEEKKAKTEVERLDRELHLAELALIRKSIDAYQKQISRIEFEDLFSRERETLHKMIQEGSSPFEAQVELDRILRIITEIGDSSRR